MERSSVAVFLSSRLLKTVFLEGRRGKPLKGQFLPSRPETRERLAHRIFLYTVGPPVGVLLRHRTDSHSSGIAIKKKNRDLKQPVGNLLFKISNTLGFN